MMERILDYIKWRWLWAKVRLKALWWRVRYVAWFYKRMHWKPTRVWEMADIALKEMLSNDPDEMTPRDAVDEEISNWEV